MSPRKYVPLIIGGLLLSALLLIQFSRSMNFTHTAHTEGKSPVQPATGQLVTERMTDIYVNVSLPESQYIQLTELNRNFMDTYPHIKVHLTNVVPNNEAYFTWAEQGAQGNMADIMLIDNGWVKPFAVRGYLKSADSIMTGDALSDQLAGLLDPLKWNGYLWGVPRDVNPYVVVWNKDMLSEAGLDEPPENWAAFQQAAITLIEHDAGRAILNLSSGDLMQLILWTERYHSEPLNSIKLQQFNEEQVSQLQWLQTISDNIQHIQLEQINTISELLRSDQLFASIVPWDIFELLNEIIPSKLLVDRGSIVLPWLNGRSYVIASRSMAEKEAMLWIQEITEISNQQLTYTHSRQLPTRASLYSANTSEPVKYSSIPPGWWHEILNAKLTDEQLVQPDPEWPLRWQLWESSWEPFSGDDLQFEAFVEAISTP